MRLYGTADFQPLMRFPCRASLCLYLCVLLASLLLASFLLASPLVAQPRERPSHALSPNVVIEDSLWMTVVHTINQMALTVSNRGVIGKPTTSFYEEWDAFTGSVIRNSIIFPRGSRRTHMSYLELWAGRDANLGPIVSAGFGIGDPRSEGEFVPLDPPGTIVRRSTTNLFGAPAPEAVSEEDLVCEYTDTIMIRRPAGWTHVTAPNPNSLGIGVRQATYGWSMRYAEDFIIAELTFKNIGREPQRNLYFGLHYIPLPTIAPSYMDCSSGSNWDQVGLRTAAPAAFGCGLVDSLDMAWSASHSGTPIDGAWLEELRYDPSGECFWGSSRGALGIMPLYSSIPMPHPNYNWWSVQYPPDWPESYDVFYFEPSQDASVASFRPDSWWRGGDKEYFRLMSTREIDYPTYRTAEIATSGFGNWNQIPVAWANTVAKRPWAECLLSWGPITMFPGGEASITFAIVGGENLHVDPTNYLNLPYFPNRYEAGLDFSDLDKNALVARWIYDNPGIDTDNDGYFGEYRVCVRDSVLVGNEWVAQKADTQWYRGDGVADFRGALPPPAPDFWVTPVHNGLHVRINGQVTETAKDIFLQKPDFEGYRVYIGRDERVASLSVAASYDLEDFDKYRLNLSLEEPEWQLTDEPFSKDELRCLYGFTPDPCNDSLFDPLHYTQVAPYRHPQYPNDSLFWFKPHDYNASVHGVSTPITRTYPDAPDPRPLPADSISDDMYTEDGYLKFYEYECTVENILPTVSYWVNVTAFDYGSPAMGVTPMESDKSKGILEAFPLHELDRPLSGSDKIYVYPNPYRVDAEYRDIGLEGRNQDDRWDERVRAVWFANLPPVCTIHIYSLDGDRVRTIEHDVPAADPTSRRHAWDLINRNYQKVETGLYYWVVEMPGEKTQVGKLAIIR